MLPCFHAHRAAVFAKHDAVHHRSPRPEQKLSTCTAVVAAVPDAAVIATVFNLARARFEVRLIAYDMPRAIGYQAVWNCHRHLLAPPMPHGATAGALLFVSANANMIASARSGEDTPRFRASSLLSIAILPLLVCSYRIPAS